jgi:hypothetical protein
LSDAPLRRWMDKRFRQRHDGLVGPRYREVAYGSRTE